MSSFLTKKKDTRIHEERISSESKETQRNKLYVVRLFHDFTKEKFSGKTIQDIVNELGRIKIADDQQTYEEALYGMLQNWNNWNAEQGRGNYTIRVLFSNLRKYLLHLGIKTNEQDIKEYLTFGKRSREEGYPLSREEYAQIVSGFARNPCLQALFFTLGSSRMRIEEATNLKKKNLDTSKERIKVNITTSTKTSSKLSKSQNISKQLMNYWLKRLLGEEFVERSYRGLYDITEIGKKILERFTTEDGKSLVRLENMRFSFTIKGNY